MAVRQDNRELVYFLLESGLKISDENWPYALCAAVEMGNVFMLHFFLRPEFSAGKNMDLLCWVLIHASEYPHTTIRIEMCRILFASYDELHSSPRTRMLVSACRSNDTIFAKWVIETEPLSFYDEHLFRGNRPPADHPMLVAVKHGSIETVRFLLSSKFKVYKDNDQYILYEAFEYAEEYGRFDIFMELVPYQTHVNRKSMLRYHALKVEYALEAVDELLGLANVTPSKTSDITDIHDGSVIEEAVKYKCVSNVEWLLKHGFRGQVAVYLQPNWGSCFQRHKSERAMFNYLKRVEVLLKAYNNPGIELRYSYHCTARRKMSEISQLSRPWDHKCDCDPCRQGPQ